MMLSDRHPILLANARIVDPSRDLDIVGIQRGVGSNFRAIASRSGLAPQVTAY